MDQPTQSQYYRWLPARKLWAAGFPVGFIADIYQLSWSGMRSRMKEFNNAFGWFPPRDEDDNRPRQINEAIKSLNIEWTDIN